jgi:diacylglycerol O-acyltransferase
MYPIVPLSRNLTLNVAILSYCGQLHFGVIGDGASGRDVELLAGGIEDSFAELLVLAATDRAIACSPDATTEGNP